MASRSGTADLPLHGGRVPPWLSARMARLGRVIVEALVLHAGRDEVLRRLAHPFWFQSFGAVMGMDWHSSGITTSVVGALKRGLRPVADELGLHVCGGRGKQSRKTPDELRALGARCGFDAEALVRASKLVAKVDNAAVQDGFQIYLHAFVVSADGRWTVVQQGMDDGGWARRYHWLSESVSSFVEAPHAAIDGQPKAPLVNLTDVRAAAARRATVDVVGDDPERLLATVLEARRKRSIEATAADVVQPHLALPGHHDVRPADVNPRRLQAALAAACDAGPRDFTELLATPGVGPRAMESLALDAHDESNDHIAAVAGADACVAPPRRTSGAPSSSRLGLSPSASPRCSRYFRRGHLVAEVICGAPARFADPARFSLAHGGKDGHPFPVPLKVYDTTLRVLRDAVDRARLGEGDRLAAVRGIDDQARRLEAVVSGQDVAAYIRRERRMSHHYGGMTVMGPAKPPRRAARPAADPAQLSLFGGAAPERQPGAPQRA